jgi:hypothetical protein
VIDVDPEYQREVVWTSERTQLDHSQTGADSNSRSYDGSDQFSDGYEIHAAVKTSQVANACVENYYIPPIILNKKRNTSSNGSASRDTLVWMGSNVFLPLGHSSKV